MSQSSSIDRLPSDVREALHGWLRELAITQTEAMERTNALLDELAAQQPVGKRVERGFSESRDRNYDFFRIPTRFKTRNSPQFPTIRRNDSDMPLLRIKRSRALRQPGHRLHGCIASPRNLPWPAGLAKWRGEGRTGHETRVTRHGFPTHDFPVKKLLPIKCPRVLRQLGHRLHDQSVVKFRLAPGTAMRPADEARPGSIWDLFDRGATQFSRDAPPLECREGFAGG